MLYVTHPSKYLSDGCIANTLLLQSSMLVTSLQKRSRFLRFSNSCNGFNVSKSLILLPERFRWVSFLHPLRKLSPCDILLSESSSFLNLGRVGKPLSVVRPALMRLRFSRFVYSSVRPIMAVLLQLSKLSSWICKKGIKNLIMVLF